MDLRLIKWYQKLNLIGYKNKDLMSHLIAKGRISPLWLVILPELERVLEDTYPGQWDFQFIPELKRIATDEYQPYLDAHIENEEINRTNRNINMGRIEGTIREEVPFPSLDAMFLKRLRYHDQIYFNLKPIIRFPEAEIQNTAGVKLPLKDMFFMLNTRLEENIGVYDLCIYKKPTLLISGALGVRTTISYDEYSAGYMHSHLMSFSYATSILEPQSFCTGSGEYNMLTSVLNSKFSADTFKMLLMHIDTMVRWESIEGNPYHHIKNVFVKQGDEGLRVIDLYTALYEAKKIIDYRKDIIVRLNTEEIKLNWRIENNRYVVVDDANLENYCLMFGNRLSSYNFDYIVRKDVNGDYYPFHAAGTSVVTPEEESFIPFRGEKFHLKVEGMLVTKTADFYIHPKIKKYVKQRLEYKANFENLRRCIIEKCASKGDSTAGVPAQS